MSVHGSVFLGRNLLRLDERDVIGEGGEGRVYRRGDRAVKIYATPDATRSQKLKAFPAHLPREVVAPMDLVTDAAGTVVGFTMRAIDGAVDLHRFANRRWREGRVSNASMLELLRRLADTVARLHTRGVVVGDLNDGNVVASPVVDPRAPSPPAATPWTPWLIDADSMQFGAYRCVVAHERFLDPRLYGVDLASKPVLCRESDWYALAVLAFGSLLYVHPFGGNHPAYGTMLRRAEARCSVLRGDVKLPHAALRPDILPDDALGWFERVFERDAREPLPAHLFHARFSRCACGIEHARASCPVCTARVHIVPVVRASGRLRATRSFATRGRIVAAVFQDGLKHAHEEDGALLREDGTEVLRLDQEGPAASFFRDPNRFARIEGSATWIGAGGRMSKIVAGRIVESIPVELARGEVAADASVAGLVQVQGDALVRARDGTRIGQVLEGQTSVRVGSSLGFAFYRAAGLTVAFVFDPRRGVLRQIEGFPTVRGKLLGWSAVFDDAHVLVTFATEELGRVRHVAHLVDARGALVATDDGGDEPVLGPVLGARTLAGGSVLTACEDGLLLARPDRRSRRFQRARLFHDAKDFVSPDADLLVGPGGSVFVVNHDEITHLSFSH